MAHTPVGVDISKDWFDVYLVRNRKPVEARFENSPAGFRQLLDWLHSLRLQRIHACMEPTGRFHAYLAGALFASGHKVSIPAPYAVSRFAECFMLRRSDDKTAARVLHAFLKTRKPPIWEPLGAEYEELRELSRHRTSLVKNLARLKNQLAAGPRSEFVQGSLRAQISYLELECERIELRMREHVDSFENLREEVAALETMKGVRFVNATRLLGEIGNWSRFPTARSLELYAGYLPAVCQSGRTVSKSGNGAYFGSAPLRRAVSACMLTASRTEEYKAFKGKLTRRGVRGVGKAAKRKFIATVYGVLKSRSAYDPKLAFAS